MKIVTIVEDNHITGVKYGTVEVPANTLHPTYGPLPDDVRKLTERLWKNNRDIIKSKNTKQR